MKSVSLTLCCAAAFAVASCTSQPKAPVDLADPMVGTGLNGHTYPGATLPHGAVQLSPDTRMANWDAASGYHYSDSTLDGFSHTHLSGTGCIDLGDILVRPTASDESPLPFDHRHEKASPGYYSVELPSLGVCAELTATTHVGVHRYTFPAGSRPEITIDLAHSLDNETIDSLLLVKNAENQLSGLRATTGWTPGQTVYFTARFSADADSMVITPDGSKARLWFAPEASPLTLAIGLSGNSMEASLANLNAEVATLDFDSVAAAARDCWIDALGVITVEGGTEAEQRNFYSALYHSLVTPNITSDAAEQSARYSTLSLWDTFRAWHPLVTITDPQLTTDIINSMLEMYDRRGELPIWPLAQGETECMIGYHSASVIADAYLKGILGFDADKALEAMVKSSNINGKGSAEYVAAGYIPANRKRESVSCTLEYAYDDWCIARMAQAMGRDDIAAEYYRRARNYENVFDGSTRFFRGRRDDGNWLRPFDPSVADRAFTEATPWHYRFFAPHDVAGLVNQFGGLEKFTAALDSLFNSQAVEEAGVMDISGFHGQYAHGNEPSHHMPYLYNYTGQPWKTQEMTRALLDEMYQPVPEGLCGNEDCGQMSAWYIFSALGFYPVCPGSGEYSLTTPLFDKAVIRLPEGRTLTVLAPGASARRYIRSVTFNGQPVEGNFITHDMVTAGGTLEYELTFEPDTTRGTAPAAAPYSLTTETVVSTPYVAEDLYLFDGATTVTLASATDGAEIRYTIDGSEPTEESVLFTATLPVDRSLTLRARAYHEGMQPSRELTLCATKAEYAPASAVAGLQPGVRYAYSEGRFSRVADIAGAPVTACGTMPHPDITRAPADDHFAYVFTGWIDIPADGIYTFMTASDDGSVLEIDGRTVVDNDGSHAAMPSTGQAALLKGMHPFTLRYFEDYEGQELQWGLQTPGAAAIAPIPDSALWH